MITECVALAPRSTQLKGATRYAHAPGRHALRAAPSDVTSQRQQEGRCASHVCGGHGRAHGELRGAGAVRTNAGGAGRQPVLGHLHCEQVRGPGRGRPAHRGAGSPLSPVRPSPGVLALGVPSRQPSTPRPARRLGALFSIQSRNTSGLSGACASSGGLYHVGVA